ncbi:MAG: histidine phosphatase family protein [Halomonas sp.]|jgi:broad specificity phosphatase PhoE|uniref:Histidine phosphatase family protein n=1 Tax=Billgrantia tianxiuensis TaxID=2497861 RepID=A0A6I6SM26_9GAMM|nr:MULTISPECIES: histidine phosphatase family protein [Halomonas]MCE8035364.1 histidine phosphatase family protein [Halomonas sp. MCCC 1A11057]MDX5433750.1 histidine phosphatase family protein [Halomonas sp.]QHC51838.1 histidine phosphatase family protein [Halomonas tianxiuensis]
MSIRFHSASGQRNNRYLLMRHGHSQANAEHLIISTPARGLAGYGLSAAGQVQLDELLANWRWPFPTRILHSDFLRTTETARRVADHFGLGLQPEPRLRERDFGSFEGLPDSRYPEVWAHDARSPEHCEYGVESVASVAARMQGVIASLEQTLRDETILLVSHGDPLQIMLTALEGRLLSEHRAREPLLPASITMLD